MSDSAASKLAAEGALEHDKITEMAPDGTYAGLIPQKKVLGLAWHWWIWIAVIYMNIMDGATAEVWKLASGLMRTEFGWSATAIAAPRAGGSWVSAGLALVTTYVYRRWLMHWKYGVMVMFLAEIVGEVWYAIWALMIGPGRLWVLWVQHIPYVILASWGGTAQYVVIVNWFESRRGLALGMTGTAGEGGTPVLWGALGGFLVPRIGYKLSWFIAGMALIPAALLHVIFVRNWPTDVGTLPWGADPKKAHHYVSGDRTHMTPAQRELAGIPPAQRWGFNLREVARVPGYWLMAASITLSPFFWYWGAYGISFHGRAIGLTTQQMGLAVTLYGFWYIIQGAMLGHTFDWKGWDYRYAVSWGPLGGIALAQGIMGYTTSVGGFMIGYLCVAMGVAAWTPMITATFADQYGPLSLGLVWGFAGRAVTSVGIALAYYGIGWTFDRWGNLYPMFKINIWTGIACMLLLVLAAKPSLKLYRAIAMPPPWAFAKNADAVRKNRHVVPVYE